MNDQKLHIIIIDDDHDIQQDFIKILNISKKAHELAEFNKELFDEEFEDQYSKVLFNFELDTASQGEEGVEKVRSALERGNPYALAFVDIRMPPGLDGIETIKKIWEIDADMQIVICTAYSDYSWEDTIKNLGVSDNLLFLKKPFDVVAVKQLASTLTKKWLVTRGTKRHTSSLNQMIDERTALLRATIESSSDGILVVDLKGEVVDYNKQFLELWSISSPLLDQKPKDKYELFSYMLDQQQDPKKSFALFNQDQTKIENSMIQIIRLKNNKIFECYSKPHRIGKKIAGRVWSFHEITEQVRLKEKLEYQATHDSLTGLPNRALLRDRIVQGIAHASRSHSMLGVVFLDLDRFKSINDSISHEIGDQLLIAMSKRLLSIIRREDTLARLGGDEFILIFPLEHNDQIITIAQKLLHSFNKPFLISQYKIYISASLGISLYPTSGTLVNTLLSQADLAMYEAKGRGGNQFIFFTNELNERSDIQFQIEAELQQAIKAKEFFLYFQPQFDIANQKILSIEALLRWKHPKKGVIYPKNFILVAESSGLIIPIGEWVIEEACKQAIQWHKMGLSWVKVAVNVATKQLLQPNFANIVAKILDKNQLDANFLEIEITENVIVNSEIQKSIQKLKDLGCNIVLDDFGTGTSSLISLKQLQIDRLKIDQTFVSNIAKSNGDETIVEAIIAISHSMNFKVIAEGIETQNQLDFLRNKNCDVIQGFLWSKPLSSKKLTKLIKEQLNKKTIHTGSTQGSIRNTNLNK